MHDLRGKLSKADLLNSGLRNYWGYNTIGFFAPDTRYAFDRSPGQVVREFKTMVRVYHEAGIEVSLDAVYNHTAEGNHYGPTLAFRGLDNPAWVGRSLSTPRTRTPSKDRSTCPGAASTPSPLAPSPSSLIQRCRLDTSLPASSTFNVVFVRFVVVSPYDWPNRGGCPGC